MYHNSLASGVTTNWSNDPSTAVSGGPWKLSSWTHGQQLVFDANPNYKGVFAPYLRQLVVKVGTADAVIPAYQAGQIDTVAYIEGDVSSPADVARAKADPSSWGVHSYSDYGTYFLVFNNQMTPFTNTKVRQAISHAIDRDSLVASAGRDLCIAAYSMLPPGFPAYNSALKSVQTYDAKLAQQLLSQASFPNGKGFPAVTLSTWGPLNPLRQGWVEGIQAQLKQNLGITVNLDVIEIKTFYAQKAKHVYPFTFQQYEYDYIDPSNLLDLWKTGAAGGTYDYANPTYDSMINQADHFTGSTADRIKLYQQAEQLLCQDAGGVFLFWPIVYQFWRPYLQGKSLQPNAQGVQAWRGEKLGTTLYSVYVTKVRPPVSG